MRHADEHIRSVTQLSPYIVIIQFIIQYVSIAFQLLIKDMLWMNYSCVKINYRKFIEKEYFIEPYLNTKNYGYKQLEHEQIRQCYYDPNS